MYSDPKCTNAPKAQKVGWSIEGGERQGSPGKGGVLPADPGGRPGCLPGTLWAVGLQVLEHRPGALQERLHHSGFELAKYLVDALWGSIRTLIGQLWGIGD